MHIKADKSLRAYYNEIDKNAAQWLRNLMTEGWITQGDVDERSIEDVRPNDLAGYDRAHFFAGVGVWDYALNQAGWGRREVWTGSCPCQPFSAAGKGVGFNDERHLWPAFHHLISQCKPAIVLGEQVDAALKSGWWDLVANDLEALDYATAAAVIPASAVGAPHIRHRLFFVAKCGAKGYNRVNAPQSKERNEHKNLPQMPTGKTTGSIFLGEAIGGREALLLQAVRQGSSNHVLDGLIYGSVGEQKSPTEKPCTQGEGLLAPTKNDLPGEVAGLSGEAESRQEGGSVRLGSARESITEPDRRWVLRTDGNPVPAGRVEKLRQPFAGQDSAGTWVHVCQRESCLLCDELRTGNMGRSAPALDIGSLEKEKGNLKNDAIDFIQTHGKNDNNTRWQADSGNQGVGAPHIRDRLYWVGHANNKGLERRLPVRQRFNQRATWQTGVASGLANNQQHDSGRQAQSSDHEKQKTDRSADWIGGRSSAFGGLANDDSNGCKSGGEGREAAGHRQTIGADCGTCGMGQSECLRGHDGRGMHRGCAEKSIRHEEAVRSDLRNKAKGASFTDRPSPTNGFWRDADWLGCRDGKWRPVEPGTFPLVNGATSRVVKLRAYGNAINAVQAQTFIESVMEIAA